MDLVKVLGTHVRSAGGAPQIDDVEQIVPRRFDRGDVNEANHALQTVALEPFELTRDLRTAWENEAGELLGVPVEVGHGPAVQERRSSVLDRFLYAFVAHHDSAHCCDHIPLRVGCLVQPRIDISGRHAIIVTIKDGTSSIEPGVLRDTDSDRNVSALTHQVTPIREA